jgi:phosphoribosylpyrophosphate synthetase
MKNVPIWERREMQEAAIQRGPGDVSGQRALLLDDLIESGSRSAAWPRSP